jgi:hypothetical protein
LLSVDTTNLDIVARPEDRHHLVGLVRARLERGPFQQPLPELAATLGAGNAPILRQEHRRLGDFQRWHRLLDQGQELIPDLYLDYMGLMGEVGALGQALKALWMAQHQRLSVGTGDMIAGAPAGRHHLLAEDQARLRRELAGVLAGLLKIANDAGIDLEDAYVDQVLHARQVS